MMVPVIDMHCDTVSEIFEDTFKKKPEARRHLRRNNLQVDLERMKPAGYMCQCFAIFIDQNSYRRYVSDPFDYLCRFSACMDREVAANEDLIRFARTGSDIERNFREGKMSALKTVEDSFVYKGDLELLKKGYGMGVRKSTLTWNYENELAFPNPGKSKGPDAIDTVNGLKKRGFEFVEAMESMGMLIDISHLNDRGIQDVFRTVKKSTPIVASHSNARGVCNHKRNLTDEMIRQLADHGGVAGLNFCPMFVSEENWTKLRRGSCLSQIVDLVRHLRYIRNVGGVDVLALGTDLDGISGQLEINGCGPMQKIAEAMELAGFTDDEIEKVLFRNVLRVYKDVLG